jgi:hypothetical protein
VAEFAANILKTEPLYYRLSRATLRDGILHLSAGGSAETEITPLQLTNLTEYFRVSYIADRYCDSYTSDIRIKVYAKSKDGNNFNYTFFPCDTEGNMFLQEFQVKATPYEQLTWRIESDVVVNVSFWELCPEAMDINTQTIIDGVQQSLPRLLYDYNTWPLTVEDSETTVGLITFRLLDKTDLQGHFIMSFIASEAAILTIRFYTGEIEELFAPLTYDIRKGYNSIGIPHCYLQRSAGFYSVMATAQVSAGIITIPARGVLYSIDGGYLAKRELDVAMDVRDLTIRQMAESYGPDEVWLAGIDAGEILVRKRDYNEVNPNVTWTPVFSLGHGKDAAIEFDGAWVLRSQAEQFTLETEEVPWFFWVDDDNTLYGQYGTDEDTKFVLDTNVLNVSACRGYSSMITPEQDQGLVVAYTKIGGSLYYKQYIYNVELGRKQWLSEVQLYAEEEWDSIKVTRLNDYRICFTLSNNNHNLWLLSDRTYVNQAAPPQIKGDFISPAWNGISIVPQSYTYRGIERVIEGARSQSEFIIDFPCDVFLYNEPYQLLTSVKLNGTEILNYDLKYTFKTQGHSLFITFERSFSGVFSFTIAPWVLYLIGNGISYMFTDSTTYNWDIFGTIVLPTQYEAHKDSVTNVRATIDIRPLKDVIYKDNESKIDTISNSNIVLTVKRIGSQHNSVLEYKTDTITYNSVAIIVTQTGDQPI